MPYGAAEEQVDMRDIQAQHYFYDNQMINAYENTHFNSELQTMCILIQEIEFFFFSYKAVVF